MKFKLPTASRKRLETLLKYLGNTGNYSKYYKGNRAEDFKKCFDIESPWCWKYADLILIGMEKRKLQYGEAHHIVPYSFYALNTKTVHRKSPKYCNGNLTVLTYAEHTYAHFCSAMCAVNEMSHKMATAFVYMFNHKAKNLPEEKEVLTAISSEEYEKVRLMLPSISKVEKEGRTHAWEDPLQAKKDYYRANSDKCIKKVQENYKKNRNEILKRKKRYYYDNRDKLLVQKKEYHNANRETLSKKHKEYYKENKERILAHDKEYYKANKEKIRTRSKLYRINHLDECKKKDRDYRLKNLEKCKAHNREYYHAHAEELNRKQKEHRQIPEVKAKRVAQQKAYREANKEKIYSRQKAYREVNKEKVRTAKKAYYDANRDKILEHKRAYNASTKEIRSVKAKAYRVAHRAHLVAQQKSKYDSMVNAGYRYRKDPVTGKRGWVFVGLPATPETPKSTSGAA